MAIIEYGNVVCKVSGINENVAYQIAARLSYEMGGFGKKNELKVLFNPKTGMTYTGLIPYVINILNKNNIDVEMVDRRVEPESNGNFNLCDWVQLRDYQQNIVDNARNRMVVQAATGAGKTCVLAAMIAKFDVKPVIVLSPKATLAYQLRDEISKFIGVEVGIMTGNETDVKDITVVTPQTVLKSTLLNEAKALLVDECQFLGAQTLFDVCRGAKNAYYRCAVSATPWRDGNDDLLIEAAINVRNPKSNVNASTLINKGKLTPCKIRFVEQEAATDWLGSYEATYNANIVNNKSRNEKIMKIIDKSIKNDDGSILVLFGRIDHGMMLKEMIENRFGSEEVEVEYKGKTYHLHTVELISGDTDMEMRGAILEAARQEKVKILLGSTIADEGLDVPALKVLILTASGKSSTRAFQRVGRVLRLYEGRNIAYVYDFMDMNTTFYKHFLYRKALYSTEPEWEKNMEVVKI